MQELAAMKSTIWMVFYLRISDQERLQERNNKLEVI